MSYKKLMVAMGIASVMLTGCTQGKDAEPATSSEVVEVTTEEQTTEIITTEESQEGVTQDGYQLFSDFLPQFYFLFGLLHLMS